MLRDYLWWNHVVDSGLWAGLTGAARGFVGLLVRRVDNNWQCTLRNENAANELRICLGHLYRARASLQRAGVLTWSTDGRRTFYQLRIPGGEKKVETPTASRSARAVAPAHHQTVRQRTKARGHSIARLTDYSSSKSLTPALPPPAAAAMERLVKAGVSKAKALEWAAEYPVAVLGKLALRIERKKPASVTGFALKVLRDEGTEWIEAAAAAEQDRQRREALEREDRERRERERRAVDDLEAMVKAAYARMTPAQRIGLHLRAAETAPTATLKAKLRTWTDGQPLGFALGLLRQDLMRPPGSA